MSLIQVKGNQEVLTPTQRTEITSNFSARWIWATPEISRSDRGMG
jgi:hypothetical protein